MALHVKMASLSKIGGKWRRPLDLNLGIEFPAVVRKCSSRMTNSSKRAKLEPRSIDVDACFSRGRRAISKIAFVKVGASLILPVTIQLLDIRWYGVPRIFDGRRIACSLCPPCGGKWPICDREILFRDLIRSGFARMWLLSDPRRAIDANLWKKKKKKK